MRTRPVRGLTGPRVEDRRPLRPEEGDGWITVNRTTVIDPDGNIVEINQILDGLDLDTEGF